MPCEPFVVEGEGGVITRGIVCTPRARRRKCSNCGRPAELLCDWKAPARKSGTCDKPICERCSTKPAPDKDLCVPHSADYRAWLAAQKKAPA